MATTISNVDKMCTNTMLNKRSQVQSRDFVLSSKCITRQLGSMTGERGRPAAAEEVGGTGR